MAAKRSASKKAKTSVTKARPAKKRVTKKKAAASSAKKPAAKKPAAKKPSKNKPAKKTGPKKSGGKSAPAAAASPRVAEIQQIIDVMVAAGAVELETEDAKGGRLRVRLKDEFAAPTYAAHPGPAMVAAPMGAAPVVAAPMAAPAAGAPDAAGAARPDAVRPDNEEEFVSPMVGTFYSAASPEAEAFISVGDTVGEDTSLCIIEAMKVMNEIKAETNGRITEILVDNGEPVEFGQPLFRLVRG